MTSDFHTKLTELLELHRQIAIVWGVADVLEIRPDLSEDQAWEVLQRCDRELDAQFGLTWEVISNIADHLYPELE